MNGADTVLVIWQVESSAVKGDAIDHKRACAFLQVSVYKGSIGSITRHWREGQTWHTDAEASLSHED
jgi:hypothetical protein